MLGPLDPSQAPWVAGLLRAAYGEHYFEPRLYDPAAWVTANETGMLISVVARTADGEVAGHVSLSYPAPSARVIEIGRAVVAPGHREVGLLGAMMAGAIEHARAVLGCELVVGAALCNHVYSQRACESLGMTVTGLEVDSVPERMVEGDGASPMSGTGSGRVATVNYARRLSLGRRRQVCLPTPYAGLIRDLLDRLGSLCRYRSCSSVTAGSGLERHSRIEVVDRPHRDVLGVELFTAGRDLSRRLAEVGAQARVAGRAMIKVAVDLGPPTVGAAVGALRAQGYFVGGVLPGWFDSDGLLMLKVLAPPNFAQVQLASPVSRSLWTTVSADHAVVVDARRVAGEARVRG